MSAMPKLRNPESEGTRTAAGQLVRTRLVEGQIKRSGQRKVDRFESSRRQNHLAFMFHYVPDTPLTSWYIKVSKRDKSFALPDPNWCAQ